MKIEQKTKCVRGEFIFLSNLEETKVSPIYWKSKCISTVCKSAKSAETRALDKCMEDAVYIARSVKEVYTGLRGHNQLKVDILTDSMSLIDSINSTRQIEDKLTRPVVKWMKQMLDSRMVSSLRWVDTKLCVADILTKTSDPLTETVMSINGSGQMIETKHEKCN